MPFILRKGYLIPSLFISTFFLLLGCTFIQADNNLIKDQIQKQLSVSSRIPGSDASQLTAKYFKDYLESFGWNVEYQEFYFDGIILRNVIAKNSSNPPQLIIGTHYDTRQYSDQDPVKSKQSMPVPGAIDGASGSALILELGRLTIDEDLSIWLVFFDGEDQGNINGWQWSVGAEYFARNLKEKPDRVVILDMLGDKDLKIYKEMNSDLELSNEIWTIAGGLGYANSFIDEQKHSFIDDHLPFINIGIPTALLIDFDYPYWHTTSDTLDKVSESNLEIVLEVMLEWINKI
jgi:Zn-dependent M28 family amino/carboxypeptidase